MLYNPPSGSTDPNAPFVGKNVAAGKQGSKVPPGALEYTQREIVAAIAASGQEPTNAILVQQAMALGRGVYVGNLTGTGDLAIATLGVVFPAFLRGMRIGAVATAANTLPNPTLRVVNLYELGNITDFPIVKEDGSALAVGEIKAGRLYRYELDGAGKVIITGGGITSTTQIIQPLIQQLIAGGKTTKFSGAVTGNLANRALTVLTFTDANTTDFENLNTGGIKVGPTGGGRYGISLRFNTTTNTTGGAYPQPADSVGFILVNNEVVGVDKGLITISSDGPWENYNSVIADSVVLAPGNVILPCAQVDTSFFNGATASGHILTLTKYF